MCGLVSDSSGGVTAAFCWSLAALISFVREGGHESGCAERAGVEDWRARHRVGAPAYKAPPVYCCKCGFEFMLEEEAVRVPEPPCHVSPSFFLLPRFEPVREREQPEGELGLDTNIWH